MVPETNERVAVAEPPIDERLTATEEMLLLRSETVQVRIVVVDSLAGMEVGENAQVEIVGAGSVTVKGMS